MIRGNAVTLSPMLPRDLPVFYNWAAKSDVTRWWYGELYADKPPTRKKFFKNWEPRCYKGRDRKTGRCFLIRVGDEAVGMIDYDSIDEATHRATIDIIIGSEKHCSKGYGSDALRALSQYLFEKYGVRSVIIAAHKKNTRAIEAYKKAGFKPVKKTLSDAFVSDYLGKLAPKQAIVFCKKLDQHLKA